MKILSLFALGSLLIVPLAVQAKIVRHVEKTFAVQPGGTFRALTQGGNIEITTGEVSEVRIDAKQTFQTDSDKEADAILADLTFRLEQQGNDVVAESRYEKKATGWFRNWPPVTVSYTVTLPREFHADVKTSGGNIQIGNLKGNVKARTSGGNLTFAKIDGELDAHTSGGNIRLEEGTAQAQLHTSGGNIIVERAGGPTSVSTSGGDIVLRSVAQLVSARTSGGNVRATITGPIKQDTELSTSGGEVVVNLPKNVGFMLEARTSGGEVDAAGLTITIEKGGAGKRRLVGAVNGGGPRLKLLTSGGDIKIRAD